MKKFNLDEYLKNPTRKLVTRDSRNVRIICTDRRDLNFPIVALIENGSRGELIYSYTKDGIYSNNVSTGYDIFFAPEKHEGWVNVYEEGANRYLDGCICVTKEEAKRIRGYGYITTIKIEWEE